MANSCLRQGGLADFEPSDQAGDLSATGHKQALPTCFTHL